MVVRRLRADGLFPAPKEIEFSCSCPDWAALCKHVAAVLYGVGARLDQQPELLFGLRRVDGKDLLARAGAVAPRAGKSPTADRLLDESALGDVFGIELPEAATVPDGVPRAAKARTASKVPARRHRQIAGKAKLKPKLKRNPRA